ncbi:protein rolling stone-like [Ruditapes philippinarum]|uniref:protein rolling stone-like n=1 Tax=Ruditapes philippinarum TaxID=129788 RepID=UPI00295B59DD|nr:protein rolling stone-like [Ruditapes philippinarum]
MSVEKEDDMGTSRCRSLREEFRLHKFGLSHEHPTLFIRPQWFPPKFYIPWTIVWALFYLINLGFEVYYDIEMGATYFTRVTNHAYLLQSLFVLTDCFVTIYVHARRQDIRDGETNGLTWYIRMQWVLFNISNGYSILVSMIYYGFLEVEWHHGSVYIHLMNSVYTVLGLLFSAKPVQLLHVYQPMVPAIFYTCFSIIYHIFGGEMIYPILDWGNKRNRTILLAVVFICVAIPIIHLICYLLYSLRVFIQRKCASRNKFTPNQPDTKKAYDSSAL